MANKQPSQIYAIQAYSKTVNSTVREFDQDSLERRHTLGHQSRLATQKAESFASRLNHNKHKGASDWQARAVLQDYAVRGQARADQILNASRR
jgi:hypothetical protein|tara:strand:+ start:1198 stop:1476 length:279 start_codon:yes stop_codon:yes gene_type:complete